MPPPPSLMFVSTFQVLPRIGNTVGRAHFSETMSRFYFGTLSFHISKTSQLTCRDGAALYETIWPDCLNVSVEPRERERERILFIFEKKQFSIYL